MKKHKRAVSMLLVLLLLMAAGMTACRQDKTEELTQILTEEEALPPVEVAMPEYELAYSGDLEDVIVLQEAEDGSGTKLDFYANLSVGKTKIFTLKYNTSEGDFVTVLTDAEENKIPVAFDMEQLPEGLSAEDENTFYLAQDAVNEIAASL